MIEAVATVNLLNADLPPVLDVEPNPDGSRASPDQYIALMNEWIAEIQHQLSRRPIIYTDPLFWNYLGNPSEFGGLPLWVADYNVATSAIPRTWTTYDFWQYEQEAQVTGVDKVVDLDVFNGNNQALEKLVQSSVLN